MKLKTAIFASMLLVAGTATAADSGFYVGAGMGYSKMNVNETKLRNSLDDFLGCSVTDLCVGSTDSDQYSTPYSIFVGYKFMKYFATEVAYLDMGSSNFKARIDDFDVTPPDTGVGKVTGDWHAKGWPISALGIWPFNDTWSVFARAGLFIGDMKVTAKASSATAVLDKGHESESSTEFFGGVGVDANFMDNWAARLEWQAMPSVGNNDTGSGNFNNFMFSIMYQF